jgi:hypothetical protein
MLRVIRSFDKIAEYSTEIWDHNLPQGRGSTLEIGSGLGQEIAQKSSLSLILDNACENNAA